MHTLSRSNVKSSKQYEVEGAFDMWDQLGLEVVPFSKDEVTDEVRIPSSEHTYTVRVKPLTFRDRLAILFGKHPECVVTDEWTEFKAIGDVPMNEEERQARRRWVLAQPPKATDNKAPTPREQAEQVAELVANFEREHNPALIEAIKKLPKPEELYLRFKRPLTQDERQAIRSMAKAVVEKKPVNMKVAV